MAWPTPSFAALTGTQPLSLFDAMFAQVAAMISIPCTASGSATAIVLTPTGTAPSLAAYGTGNFFNFKAVGNSTSAVTIQFMALAALPLYFADGTTQVTTQIVSGRNYIVGFDAALNTGSGGYYLPMPQMPGTAGQVLTMAASGPAYATPVNSAMVLLNTLTASNSASLADTTSFTSTYSSYQVIFNDLVPVTDGANLMCQLQVSGVFQTTGYAGICLVVSDNPAVTPVVLTDGSIITGGQSNSNIIQPSGRILFHNPSQTTNDKCFEHMCWFNTGVNFRSLQGNTGYQSSNAAVTGFRLIYSSGNIASGTARVYGIS